MPGKKRKKNFFLFFKNVNSGKAPTPTKPTPTKKKEVQEKETDSSSSTDSLETCEREMQNGPIPAAQRFAQWLNHTTPKRRRAATSPSKAKKMKSSVAKEEMKKWQKARTLHCAGGKLTIQEPVEVKRDFKIF